MKNTFALFLFVIGAFTTNLSAQNMYEEAIGESLHNFQQALLVKDFKTAASHLHPGVVEKGGGTELYADILEAEMDSYLKSGIKIMDISSGKPGSPVAAGGEIHCIIPQEVTMLFGEKYFKGIEHLLAASMDEGKTWYFVDLKTFDAPSLKEFIPNFNDALEIPQNPPMEEIK